MPPPPSGKHKHIVLQAAVVPEPVLHFRQNAFIFDPCAHPAFDYLSKQAVHHAGDRERPVALWESCVSTPLAQETYASALPLWRN